MSQTKLFVEVMDSTNTWNDITADTKRAVIKLGMKSPRSYFSAVGSCQLSLNNKSKTYNPDINTYVSALLENRRRLRVRGTGATLGNALQIIQTRVNTSLDQAGIQNPITVSIAINDTITVSYQARAQFDSQWNADRLVVTTSGETFTAQLPVYTNKWKTYTYSFTATQTATTVTIKFDNHFPVSTGNNANTLEYKKVTLTKNGGANLLSNGDFSNGLTGWSTYQVTGTVTATVISDYWTLFNGVIEDIVPAPFVNAGSYNCDVLALDWTEILRLQMLDLPLQKNQRGDQLNSTALAVLPTGTLNTTLPGTLQDTGLSTFVLAFDGYTKNTFSILDATADSAISEYGIQWVDRDGTFRWAARSFLPKRVIGSPMLSLADGMPFDMKLIRSTSIVMNKANILYHPRQTGASNIILGTITSPITIPPVQPGAVPGAATVTLTFVDPATSRLIGGDSVVTPLVATTDYKINTKSDGTGTDYTTNSAFSIGSVTVSASQATIVLNNTSNQPLYATTLQIRGKGIFTYNPITITQSDATSITTYQERTNDMLSIVKDLPFGDDPTFTTSLAQYLVGRYKNPFLEVSSITSNYEAQLNGVDLLGIELMDMIAVSDTQTAMTNLKHLIIGVNYDLVPQAGDYLGSCTFTLERLDQSTYWILNDTTYSVLGTTTRLYI